MKKWFLTFADKRFSRALDRIRTQAVNLNFYDEIITADESNLEPNFMRKYQDQIKVGVRGFGYWAWKPQIILQVLDQMSNGDILQYTDAGCHLNSNGLKRLVEYFQMASVSDSGILAFQAIPPSFHDNKISLPDLEEKKWSKADLFIYLNCLEDPKILNTQQYGAGIIFIKKSSDSVRIIEQWAKAYKDNFSLIDDTASKFPNYPGFIEHRHDQSIFSILCKINNVATVSAYEYWYPGKKIGILPDWKILKNYPIHVRRDKGVHFLMVPMSLIFRVLRRLRFEFIKYLASRQQ